jgi:Fe-S-cluster-containing dehydrogenase component/formate-dependent nitrite reductase membrane component NrfD
VKLGFVIDQRVCIGCHACTVACKAENDVPVGDFRTWVKYVERGGYPDVRRSFLVERCNHCEGAPCVAICPVEALYIRPDGIVDFNSDQCIGCRGCQAACPYDAIYMDGDAGGTVAKCNFCSHRIDQRLQPACVVVCPTDAILFGDMGDPASEVSVLANDGQAARPREEVGTIPKLAYIGASPETMAADRTSLRPSAIWTSPWDAGLNDGPPSLAETIEPHDVYNIAHESPWRSMVSVALGAKSVATGALLLAALAIGVGYDEERELAAVGGPILALVFVLLTGHFLTVDLERPERLMRIVFQPNWRSWFVRGAYLLIAFAAAATLWLVLELAGAEDAIAVIAWITVPISVLTAAYTAFLFCQAPGRELWQTWVYLPHLLARSAIGGAAAWLIVVAVADTEREVHSVLAVVLAGGLAVSVLATAIEFARRDTVHLERASALALSGRLAPLFWGGIGGGHVAPAILIAVYLAAGASTGLLLPAAVLASLALVAQDEVWVRAGQAVPQS